MPKETFGLCNPHRSPQQDAIDAGRMAMLCKALAHPARVMIVAHLKQINQCICGQLVEVLPLAQSTVSQHLKILKQAGLVKGEVEGPRTCYCINPDALQELQLLIEGIAS